MTELPTHLPDGQVLRITIDADCPRCGWGERFYEPAREVFGCTKRTDPCGYESKERDPFPVTATLDGPASRPVVLLHDATGARIELAEDDALQLAADLEELLS